MEIRSEKKAFLGPLKSSYSGGGGLVAKRYLTLCDPMDCSPPDSSVHGISQQEYWNGLTFLSPNSPYSMYKQFKAVVQCSVCCFNLYTSPLFGLLS